MLLKKCPFCAEEIHADAIKCKHCNEFLEKKVDILETVSEKINNNKISLSFETGVSFLMVLSFFLPWLHWGIFSVSGYEIPLTMSKIDSLYSTNPENNYFQFVFFIYPIVFFGICSLVGSLYSKYRTFCALWAGIYPLFLLFFLNSEMNIEFNSEYTDIGFWGVLLSSCLLTIASIFRLLFLLFQSRVKKN